MEIDLYDLWLEDKVPAILDPQTKDRKHQYQQIVIEVLRLVDPKAPTRWNLQRLCKIRRKQFLRVLRYLIDCGVVLKIGTGVKGDPYRYRLVESYRPKPNAVSAA